MEAKESSETRAASKNGPSLSDRGPTKKSSGKSTKATSERVSPPTTMAKPAASTNGSTTMPSHAAAPLVTVATDRNKGVSFAVSSNSTMAQPQAKKTSVSTFMRPLANTNTMAASAPNTGNDQVTVDKPKLPLVAVVKKAPSSSKSTGGVRGSASTSQQKTSVAAGAAKATISSKSASSQAKASSSSSVNSKQTSGDKPSASSVTNEQEKADQAIKEKRAPLTTPYGPYIIPPDTTLEGARLRLRTAIEQTRQLREAFTERVYGKYRVCLQPPASTERILTYILTDPHKAYQQLDAEMQQFKEEKEIEKKQAQKLNAEMLAATQAQNSSSEPSQAAGTSSSTPTTNPLAAMNAENAEQLMYLSAGLSLIVLPEQNVDGIIDMSVYTDRSPINPETGQRVRTISAAAAAAGEVMLDRSRKGAAMREDRLRRRQMQLLSGKGQTDADGGYAQLSSLSTIAASASVPIPKPVITAPPPPTTIAPAKPVPPKPTPPVKPVKRPSASKKPSSSIAPHNAANAKAIRARVQASMSTQTLLSLNPSAEELRIDGKSSAATKALLQRGVNTHGATSKTNQQMRFRHPFPDSLGGRRRTLGGSSGGKDASSEALSHPAYVSVALPPLPTAKERRSRKPSSNILPLEESATDRAKSVIQTILDQFVQDNTPHRKKRRITEISFQHGVRSQITTTEASETAPSKSVEDTNPARKKDIDPMLAFNVLKAVGLVTASTSGDNNSHPKLFPSNLDTSMFEVAETRAMGEEGGQSRSSVAKLKGLVDKFSSHKRSFLDAFYGSTDKGEESKTSPEPPVLTIRGGGEMQMDSSEKSAHGRNNPAQSQPNSRQNTESKPAETGSSNHSSQPGMNTANASSNPGARNHRMVWEDPSRNSLVLLNNGLAQTNGGNNLRIPSQMQTPDNNYHPHVTPNAIQLAHHLRHATASLSRVQPPGHHAAGDLAEYIGGLQPQAGPYDWSIGAASAAAVASTHSLAALGMNPHRAAMVNFSVQDRARALMAREQHNVAAAAAHAAAAHRQHQAAAFLGGAGGHGYAQAGHQSFPHLVGPTSHMLGSPASMMGHPSMAMVDAPKTAKGASRKGKKTDAPSRNDAMSSRKDAPKKNAVVATDNGDPGNEAKKRKLSDDPFFGVQVNPKKSRGDEARQEGEKKNSKAKTAAGLDEADSSEPPKTQPPEASASTSESQDHAIPSPPGTPKGSVHRVTPNEVEAEDGPVKSSAKGAGGLQLFIPPAPTGLSSEAASEVLAARACEAVKLVEKGEQSAVRAILAEYMVAVGSAVPIPKALVANSFKEKMNTSEAKANSIAGVPASSRDAAVASIILWLWKYHENCFQSAFAKSGRIDVDPACKWLIQAAVDRATQAISSELASPSSRLSKTLNSATKEHKAKGNTAPKSNQGVQPDRTLASCVELELLVAAAASKALMSGLVLNAQMDATLPHFHDLLDYLDEVRTCALHSKSQERALLAALIARKATMSLPFSHAYASSMVRAGEALGHGELFEVVQNEEASVCTMIPYDVFTDESGAWEDPCRPIEGFTKNLTGDGLMRRAHARAMIQKSLKKLQDRHSIKGGTPNPGPYVDPPSSTSGNTDSSKSNSNLGSTTPRGWLKRRSSFSEPPVLPGTGSAAATSWSLYDPKHFSAPLFLDSDYAENGPYGRHNNTARPRSLSLSQSQTKQKGSRGKISGRSISVASYEQAHEKVNEEGEHQSTLEIAWADVAGIFQSVQLPGMSQAIKEKEMKTQGAKAARGKTIFAPYVRKVELSQTGEDSESDEEDDLSDEEVLRRHQVGLDEMKEKLSVILEARKNNQKSSSRKSSSKK